MAMKYTDDMIKTSGHRVESTEIEFAITSHTAVAEVAVIGIPDKIKGESVTAYVVLKKVLSRPEINFLKDEIVKLVESSIGRFACPSTTSHFGALLSRLQASSLSHGSSF